MSKQVTVFWTDYTKTVASNPTECLRIIAKKQWEDFDAANIKRTLARRAYDWNGSMLDFELSDYAFLKALGDTGMVFVWFGDGDPFASIV